MGAPQQGPDLVGRHRCAAARHAVGEAELDRPERQFHGAPQPARAARKVSTTRCCWSSVSRGNSGSEIACA